MEDNELLEKVGKAAVWQTGIDVDTLQAYIQFRLRYEQEKKELTLLRAAMADRLNYDFEQAALHFDVQAQPQPEIWPLRHPYPKP